MNVRCVRVARGLYSSHAMRAAAVVLLLVAACHPPGYGKGDDGDDAPPSDANDNTDATVVGDAGLDTPTAQCRKAFHLDGHATASAVYVTGTFSAWAPNPPGAIALTKTPAGAWEGSYDFAPGTYQYKFVIDGSTWITDPTNPDVIDDGMGNVNSAYTCAP